MICFASSRGILPSLQWKTPGIGFRLEKGNVSRGGLMTLPSPMLGTVNLSEDVELTEFKPGTVRAIFTTGSGQRGHTRGGDSCGGSDRLVRPYDASPDSPGDRRS